MHHQKIGLFVIDKDTKQTIILKRSTPYNDSVKTLDGGFVEEYCIPRGNLKHDNETDLECGVREFIEECQLFFSEFYIIPETFDLEWRDPPNKLWKYKIFFLFVSMKHSFSVLPLNVRYISSTICSMIRDIDFTKSIEQSECKECLRKYNIQCMKSAITHVKIPINIIHIAATNTINKIPENIQRHILTNKKNLSAFIDKNKILKPFRKDIKKIQGIQRENIYKMIMHINDYMQLMNKRLKYYTTSNYRDFFVFIQKISVTYDI